MPGAPGAAAARVALAATATAAGGWRWLQWWQPSRGQGGAERVGGAWRIRRAPGAGSPAWASVGGKRALTLDSAAQCVAKQVPGERPIGGGSQPYRCGEDAYFLAAPTAALASVGIADGVGGWARRGVEPARFSWELMGNCRSEAELGEHDPKIMLQRGYEALLRSRDVPAGGCTACVASLDRRSGELRVANLGDSGAMLIRADGHCVLESTAQHHSFNCPYQLGVEPQTARPCADHPRQADIYAAQVQAGDLLVLATDGFLDNVWRADWLEAVAALRGAKPSEIASALVELAHSNSLNSTESPFSSQAARYGMRHWGGKPDDITVIVARIEEAPDDGAAA